MHGPTIAFSPTTTRSAFALKDSSFARLIEGGDENKQRSKDPLQINGLRGVESIGAEEADHFGIIPVDQGADIFNTCFLHMRHESID